MFLERNYHLCLSKIYLKTDSFPMPRFHVRTSCGAKSARGKRNGCFARLCAVFWNFFAKRAGGEFTGEGGKARMGKHSTFNMHCRNHRKWADKVSLRSPSPRPSPLGEGEIWTV